MILNLKRGFFSIVFMVLVFSSCRTEDSILISGSNEPNLKANSTIADLIHRISTKDGSGDDVIDDTSCFCLHLPVTVIVNSMMVEVNSTNMEEVCKDKDVQVIFPVTITLSDHAEVTINNQNAYNGFKNNCNEQNETDEVIECLDFKYPIEAYVYNSTTDQSKVITINEDKKMYRFIERLDRHETTNLKFPITIILHDETEINVNSLIGLENTINSYKNDCN